MRLYIQIYNLKFLVTFGGAPIWPDEECQEERVIVIFPTGEQMSCKPELLPWLLLYIIENNIEYGMRTNIAANIRWITVASMLDKQKLIDHLAMRALAQLGSD